MAMGLQDLQQNWELLGKEDPYWAILSKPGTRGNRWEPDAFYATGRAQIAELMDELRSLEVPVRGRAALDFGCGAGRLTQALCEHFESVRGIDIATSMLDLARRNNRHGARCEYVLNPHPDLRDCASESFDLVLSLLVLQHMAKHYAESYLREFARVLRPGGVVVFQVPSGPAPTWKGRLLRILSKPPFSALLNRYRRARDGCAGAAEMHSLPRARVEELLRTSGLRLVDAQRNEAAGPTWISWRYVAVR